MLQMTREARADAPSLSECDVDELVEQIGEGLRSLLVESSQHRALEPQPAEAVLALMGCCVGRPGDWRGLARDLRAHMLRGQGEVQGCC